ncbi:MAG TPA: GNAT family N-acetyltransferase [Lacipirellulaceae bacterium]
MSRTLVDIVPCPAALVQDALELVLRELPPEHRDSIAAQVAADSYAQTAVSSTLFVAQLGDRLCGAAWGQLQPGKTAIFWVPQLTQGVDAKIAERLTQAVARALDYANVEMAQTLLPDRSSTIASAIESGGFSYLAELMYLAGESSPILDDRSDRESLEFIAYDDSQRGRLIDLVERTYLESHDCAAMNGKRQMDDVLDGYQATGDYRPGNWLIVRGDGLDVGVLLMSEEPAAGHFELIYMGVVPEARGKGWGVQIARHALRLAHGAGAERVVLAVDAANGPALAMYGAAGFTMWDRRSVFVRFRGS